MTRFAMFFIFIVFSFSTSINILNESIDHGQIYVSKNKKCSLFYILYKSRDQNPYKEIPLTIFITGGPGISNMYSLISGIGPFKLNANDDLIFRDHTLNLITDLLFIEQPLGTNGFSPCFEESELPNSEDNYVDNLYDFFHEFYKRHNNYQNITTYFVGESYAGHLIPKLVKKIYTHSQDKMIQIGGIMLLAPLVCPILQFSSYSKYAAWKLNSKFNEYMQIMGNDLAALILSKANRYSNVLYTFGQSYNLLAIQNKRNFTVFNIKEKCIKFPCASFESVNEYFNRKDVQDLLEVHTNFTDFTPAVRPRMIDSFFKDNSDIYDEILQKYNISTTILIGHNDFIINILGELSWIKDLEYYKINQGNNAKYKNFKLSKTNISKKSIGNLLNIYKIDDVGHVMTYDNPEIVSSLFRTLVKRKEKTPKNINH